MPSPSTEPRTVAAKTSGRHEDRKARARRALSFRNIGALYILAIVIVIFTIWAPTTFPTIATVRQVLNGNAVNALLALALVIPLSARVFDLSIAYVATLSGVTATYLIAHGTGVEAAVLLALGVSLLAGLGNATVVVVMGVDSFIGTLATGAVIQAIISLITQDIAITDPRLSQGFADIGQQAIGNITLPVLYALVVAVAIWFVQDHTASGRRLYATGFNAESARLAGVRTDRLRFVSLLVSALISGAAGICLMSTIGSGDPTAGTPYLLSAFTAAFLGATQLRGGRFNAWGTVIAVLLIGTGDVGLALASAPPWSTELFQGVVLIAALAVTGQQRRALALGSWWRRARRGRRSPAVADSLPHPAVQNTEVP